MDTDHPRTLTFCNFMIVIVTIQNMSANLLLLVFTLILIMQRTFCLKNYKSEINALTVISSRSTFSGADDYFYMVTVFKLVLFKLQNRINYAFVAT